MSACLIILNGSDYPLDQPCSVSSLLNRLALEGKPVVVELNGVALFPREFDHTSLADGDKVEIISIVAGG